MLCEYLSQEFPLLGTIKGYCVVLYCIVLYCIVLYCIVLYCIVLYCIVLYCIVLYCIVLYCVLQKNSHLYFKYEDPDIICLQETKCDDANLPKEMKLDGYHAHWAAAEKKGYSGTGLFSKVKPLEVTYGLGGCLYFCCVWFLLASLRWNWKPNKGKLK